MRCNKLGRERRRDFENRTLNKVVTMLHYFMVTFKVTLTRGMFKFVSLIAYRSAYREDVTAEWSLARDIALYLRAMLYLSAQLVSRTCLIDCSFTFSPSRILALRCKSRQNILANILTSNTNNHRNSAPHLHLGHDSCCLSAKASFDRFDSES